ncbi:unnamed protein product [Kuraishia capsulata CBS 1993]|uniref:Zn(2)-C6 fungal-type domain-containing protein n=1 Tax=Kuraishia capsulata CBS 1993 TaxID=1382522 RepID=W6ML33_9ASCO|nr:uncharacterized protein KUCA_T00003128001 [Kuraishia capsulata CBS 1993]CDK27151.1 unnamed protein product [Kuraishia capsulata CBS 1993]
MSESIKITRVKKACTPCKLRRIKCDGEFPCASCLRHDKSCDYSTTETLQNVRQPFKNSKPTKDEYIKYLENRVFLLEAEKTKDRIDSVDPDALFLRDHLVETRLGGVVKFDGILMNKLANSLFASLSAEEREKLAVPRVQFYGWNMSGNHYLQQFSLDSLSPILDPTEDTSFCDWLVQFYLVNINPLFSILHEEGFLNQLIRYRRELYADEEIKSTRLFMAMLSLVFAISIRFAEFHPAVPPDVRTKMRPGLEEQLFLSAYEVVSKLSFEWQSLELIQSWILITLYLRTAHRQSSSHASLGTAIRMCKGMLLNVDVAIRTKCKTPYEITKVERVFWLVYTWDKLYAWQSGRHHEIYDEHISLRVPELDNPEVLDGWLQRPALAMIHLAKIAAKIQRHNTKHYYMDPLFLGDVNNQLNGLKNWVDRNLRDGSCDSLMVDQVYLTYHDIALSLHSKDILNLVGGQLEPFDNASKTYHILAEHSAKVLKVFENIDSLQQLQVPWWLNLTLLFTISVTSIVFMNAGLYLTQCPKILKGSIHLLTSLKQTASMAAECVWALKMLNHMCVLRLNKSAAIFNNIGVDHGPSAVNDKKFNSFNRVEGTTVTQEADYTQQQDEACDGIDSVNFLDLEFATIQDLLWFDTEL